jgi:hypothetical protein
VLVITTSDDENLMGRKLDTSPLIEKLAYLGH